MSLTNNFTLLLKDKKKVMNMGSCMLFCMQITHTRKEERRFNHFKQLSNSATADLLVKNKKSEKYEWGLFDSSL